MIATLAASAALSSATLAFAPPLDRPLHYEVTERRPRPDGTIRSATLVQEIVFAADRNGYAMTIRTTGYRSASRPDDGAAFDAAIRPMVGTAFRIHVSAGGVPERVIDGAASWSAMLAALRTEISARPPGDAARGPARSILASLDATPPAARDARLIAAADDVLGTRLPPLAVGGEAGTFARAADADGEVRYRERTTHVAAGRSVETNADFAVSRETGLVTHILRRAAVAAAPAPVMLSESETVLISKVF